MALLVLGRSPRRTRIKEDQHQVILPPDPPRFWMVLAAGFLATCLGFYLGNDLKESDL